VLSLSQRSRQAWAFLVLVAAFGPEPVHLNIEFDAGVVDLIPVPASSPVAD
jgi:hypothetical protein